VGKNILCDRIIAICQCGKQWRGCQKDNTAPSQRFIICRHM